MQFKSDYKTIINIAYPIILSSVAQQLVQMSDAVFLGRVGVTELGAIGLSSVFYMIILMLALGYSRGAQIIIARKAGENKISEIGLTMDNLIYFLGGMMVIGVLLMYFVTPPFFKYLLTSEDVYEASVTYIHQRTWALPFAYLLSAFNALYTGLGRTKIILGSTIFLSLCNVLLNYMLIFGNFGCPELGIQGAGMASSISEVLTVILFGLYIAYDRKMIQFNLFQFKPIDFEMIYKTSKISFPIVLQHITGLASWFFFFSIIESMGEEELAISNVLKVLYLLIGVLVWGLSTANNTLTSNVIGQGKSEEMFPIMWKVMRLAYAIMLIPMIVLWFFPEFAMSFGTDDVNLIQMGVPLCRMLAILMILFTMSNIVFSALFATGATMMTLYIELASVIMYTGYLIVAVYIFDANLLEVWYSEFFFWGTSLICAWLFLKSGKWKDIKL